MAKTKRRELKVGHIERRGENSWRIKLGAKKLSKGKYDTITETVIGTEAEARLRLERIARELELGIYEPSIKQTGQEKQQQKTVKEVYLDWLKVRSVGKKPNTIRDYEDQAEYYILPAFGDKLIADVTMKEIEDQYASWQKDVPLSPASIWHIHVVMMGIFGYAKKHGLIEDNPLNGAIESLPPRPNRSLSKDEYWTIQEIHSFLRAVSGEQYRIYFLLALATGMRVNEIRALRWANVDLEGKRIWVCEAIKQEENIKAGIPLIIGPPKTKSGYRWVPIPDELCEDLREHKQLQDEIKRELGSMYEDNDLVIANDFGKVVNKGHLARVMLRNIKKANELAEKYPKEYVPVKRIPLKNLRHTHACALLAMGVDMKTISQRLGHKSYAFTAQIYAHAVEDLEIDAATRSGMIIAPQKTKRNQKKKTTLDKPDGQHFQKRYFFPKIFPTAEQRCVGKKISISRNADAN